MAAAAHSIIRSHFFEPFWSQAQGKIPGKKGVVIFLKPQGPGQIPRSNPKVESQGQGLEVSRSSA